MTIGQARTIRKWLGRITALFFFVIIFALLDGCMAKVRQPLNLYHVLPGTTVPVDGQLPEKLRDISQLTHKSSSDKLRLTITELLTGYWLGTNMWIGHVEIDPDTAPGEYTIKVEVVGRTYPETPPPHRFIVYKDEKDLNRHSLSYTWRFLDLSPWWLAISCLPFAAFLLWVVFLYSQRIEKLLLDDGKAEVFMVKGREGGGFLIGFGFGTQQGIRPGDVLMVYDEAGAPVGKVTVEEVTEKGSTAIADADTEIRQGHIVSLR